MKALFNLACLVVIMFVCWGLFSATTDPNYQQGLTARRQAREQTRQVQAREWGETTRTLGEYGSYALIAAAVAGVGGWACVEWQRNRTRRHEVTEDHTTQRHLISAKRDIALAYLAVCGDPDATQGRLNGIDGVFLPSAGEFVPLDVCRQELQANRLLPAPPERRFAVVWRDT
jgi:hypothetical protein